MFVLFWNARLGGQFCNNFVLKLLQDHLLDTIWHAFFQAHFRKVQTYTWKEDAW